MSILTELRTNENQAAARAHELLQEERYTEAIEQLEAAADDAALIQDQALNGPTYLPAVANAAAIRQRSYDQRIADIQAAGVAQ